MPVSRSNRPVRYSSSEALLDAHLQRLQQRHGMALWMITRVRDDVMWLLRVNDDHYGLEQGHRIEWQRSYCIRMVEQDGPCIVTDTREASPYRAAPINDDLEIGAYVGLPLLDARGALFGTLCALAPKAQPASLADRLPELEHDAALISFTLQRALRDAQQQRLSTFIEHPDRCDETGLPSAVGWRDILAQEQGNCINLGEASSVMYLQAAEDADSLVIADSLAALLRDQDSVAHLGNNQFGILLADTHQRKAAMVADRIRDALNAKRLLVKLQQEPLSPF